MNRILANNISILNPGAADGNAKPRWDLTSVPGAEYPIVDVSEPVGRSMSGDPQLTERCRSSGGITTPQGGRRRESLLPLLADSLSQHIVVVDNIHDSRAFRAELDNCRSAVDFREILVRDQSSWEERERKTLRASLNKHDVINLQFTRLSPPPISSMRVGEGTLTLFSPPAEPQDTQRRFHLLITICSTTRYLSGTACA